MKPVWETFEPRHSPEEALKALHRRMHRRRMARIALPGMGLLVFVIGVFALIRQPVPRPTLTPAFTPVVQRAWAEGRDASLIIFKTESGHSVIFIQPMKEVVR